LGREWEGIRIKSNLVIPVVDVSHTVTNHLEVITALRPNMTNNKRRKKKEKEGEMNTSLSSATRGRAPPTAW